MEKRVMKKIAEASGKVLVMENKLDGTGLPTYVVCSKFNEGKAEAFENIMCRTTSFVYAVNLILGFDSSMMPQRYKEICDGIMRIVVEDKDEDELNEIADKLELDDNEREKFGFPDNKKYDVVEVTFTRTFTCTKRFVVPSGTDEYEFDNYFDAGDLDDCEFEENFGGYHDTDIKEFSVEEEELSRKEVPSNTWNDVDDLD